MWQFIAYPVVELIGGAVYTYYQLSSYLRTLAGCVRVYRDVVGPFFRSLWTFYSVCMGCSIGNIIIMHRLEGIWQASWRAVAECKDTRVGEGVRSSGGCLEHL